MPAHDISIEVFADNYIRTFGSARDDDGLRHFLAVMALCLQMLPLLVLFRPLLYSKHVRHRSLLVHCVLRHYYCALGRSAGYANIKVLKWIFAYQVHCIQVLFSSIKLGIVFVPLFLHCTAAKHQIFFGYGYSYHRCRHHWNINSLLSESIFKEPNTPRRSLSSTLFLGLWLCSRLPGQGLVFAFAIEARRVEF